MQNKLFRKCRWLFTCSVSVLISIPCGCSKKKAVSDNNSSTHSIPLSAPAQLSDSVPTDGAKPTHIDRPVKIQSVSESLQRVDRRQLSAELYTLAHERSQDAVKRMIDFLSVEERSLPGVFPDLETMKNLEKNPPTGDHWVNHIQSLQLTVRSLILSDTKEGASAADAFIGRFTQKYGLSEVGQLFVKSLAVEVQQAKKDLKNGLAPWRLGLQRDKGEERDGGRSEGTDK